MTIREALPSDAVEIAPLTGQLGYPSKAEAVSERLGRIAGRPDQRVFVAVLEEKVVGCLQVFLFEAFQSGLRAEITGVVVADGCRGRGIGRSLIARAEEWAAGTGVETMVVHSNTKRVEAHKFYPALGYVMLKTQAFYQKSLKK